MTDIAIVLALVVINALVRSVYLRRRATMAVHCDGR